MRCWHLGSGTEITLTDSPVGSYLRILYASCQKDMGLDSNKWIVATGAE